MTQELQVNVTIYKNRAEKQKYVPGNTCTLMFNKVEGEAPTYHVDGDRELLIRRLTMIVAVLES